jgi:hypothetical protein
VLLSSPAAAQRCAEGAGLDSGAVAAAPSETSNYRVYVFMPRDEGILAARWLG